MIAPNNANSRLTAGNRMVEHPPEHGNPQPQRHPARHARTLEQRPWQPGSGQRLPPFAHLPAGGGRVPRTRIWIARIRRRQGDPGRPAHGQFSRLDRRLVCRIARGSPRYRREHVLQTAGAGKGVEAGRHRHAAHAGQPPAPQLRAEHGARAPGARFGTRRAAAPCRCALSPIGVGMGRGRSPIGPGATPRISGPWVAAPRDSRPNFLPRQRRKSAPPTLPW